MEKKKEVKKSNLKSTKTTKKTSVKKTTPKKKTTAKKKGKKRGFTLIELLAVIIILGILMIIAIPSVTTYISNSRKSSYVDTVKNIVGAARNLVNGGKLETYDRDSTYYISVKCLQMENGASTPYGDFTEAYVVVTYNGDGYDYYFTGTDSSHTGIKKIVPADKLDVDYINTEVEDADIRTDIGIAKRKYVRIINGDSCKAWNDPINAEDFVDSDGNEIEMTTICHYTNIHPDYKLHDVSCYSDQTVGECLGSDTIYLYPSAYRGCIYNTNEYYHVTDETIWYEHTGPNGYGNFNWGMKMKACYNSYSSSVTLIDKNTKVTEVQANTCLSTVPASIPRYTCLCVDTEVIVLEEDKNGNKRKVRKKLKDLKYTDLVLVWDFDKAEFAWAKPLWIRKEEISKSYYLIKFSDGKELKVIGEHKIFNADTNKFVSLLKSKVGFNTYNSEGKLVKVVSRKLIDKKIEFTSVITNKHMNLFTNDVLTSISYNNLYKIKDMKFVKENVVKNSIDMYEGVPKKYFDGLRISEMGMKFATTDVIRMVKEIDEIKK